MFELNDGDILFDRFEIERLLGHGGMGEVYKARDIKLERLVAIKTIKLKNFKDPAKAKERFLGEGKLTAKLNHTNIVKVHDLLEDENQLYLVMEYLEGDSLADKLKKGALPREDALKIYEEIKEALSYLHRLEGGILHRDVSPHNIFVQEKGEAKLLDYGVSKIEDIDSGITETYYYKLSYSCPELWEKGIYQGRRYSLRHDYYSLALICYEMLTGEKVFREMEVINGYPKLLKPSGIKEIDQIIQGNLLNDSNKSFTDTSVKSDNLKPTFSIIIFLIISATIFSIFYFSENSNYYTFNFSNKRNSPYAQQPINKDACKLYLNMTIAYSIKMDDKYRYDTKIRNHLFKKFIRLCEKNKELSQDLNYINDRLFNHSGKLEKKSERSLKLLYGTSLAEIENTVNSVVNSFNLNGLKITQLRDTEIVSVKQTSEISSEDFIKYQLDHYYMWRLATSWINHNPMEDLPILAITNLDLADKIVKFDDDQLQLETKSKENISAFYYHINQEDKLNYATLSLE